MNESWWAGYRHGMAGLERQSGYAKSGEYCDYEDGWVEGLNQWRIAQRIADEKARADSTGDA